MDSGSAVLPVDASSAGADVGGADRALAKAGAAAWRAAHTLSSEPKNAQGWADRGAALPCCCGARHTLSAHMHTCCA